MTTSLRNSQKAKAKTLSPEILKQPLYKRIEKDWLKDKKKGVTIWSGTATQANIAANMMLTGATKSRLEKLRLRA